VKNQPGINRIPVNNLPNGRVVRKVPKPFARPSITIGTPPTERREWRTVRAYEIREGDVIPGLGMVTRAEEINSSPKAGSGLDPEVIADSVVWQVYVWAGEDNMATYQGNTEVWCFARPATVDAKGRWTR
jgi:hypothetical protein